MSDEAAAGGASKSAVKKAAADAAKAAKKKPDPDGLKLIEAAETAKAANDLEKALALFTEAKAKCEASSVDAVTRVKAPKAAKPEGGAGEGAPKGEAKAAATAAAAEEEKKPRLYLSMPEENTQAKPLRDGVDAAHNYALNPPEKLKAHLAATGGHLRTRFPPEPNGYLHIGHAKAMNFNFGQAKIAREMGKGGETVLRFDDTNPTAEKQEFIDSILDSVAWLGHTPYKVTYSSDYFQDLYDLAVQLIRDGGAYVCHQTGDEIKASRDLLRAYHGAQAEKKESSKRPPLPKGASSPWRDRPVDDNLKHFTRMRQGRYGEGEAVLRMKGDLYSENSSMWDLAAYRVMFHEHPRTGNKWCIYPTYDYTHCIVDSLENITHSLCTLEFGQRQAVDGPYYHLLHGLRLYKPVTWEYSRANLTHAVMSKRKLKFLVEGGYVGGWDDPRLCTLNGFRRRGYTGSAMNQFCTDIGVTKAAMTAKNEKLEQIIRQELESTAPRRFAVLKPLRVELRGLPGGSKAFDMPNHPKDESFGSRPLVLTETIYIEQDDYRPDLKDDPKFFGLAMGREAGLLGAGVHVTVTEEVRDSSGALSHLVAAVDATRERKVKGHLHWVSAAHAVRAECRVYGVLFAPEDPEAAAKETAAAAGGGGGGGGGDGEEDEEEEEVATGSGLPPWLKLLNPKSLVVEEALVESALATAATPPVVSKDRPAFQFQRVGFFCVDNDSTATKPIFNRVVALREDKEKKGM